MKLKHFKELDGVRAIAALMVMFFHFFKVLDTNNHLLIIIKKFAIFGQTGVSLFFVLSGFLITRILINTKQAPFYFKNFYIRRSLRIFPLYYFFLILYYLTDPFIENKPSVSFDQQIWFWVYLQNFSMTFNWGEKGPGHFWSLAVEEHFYLFWPLLIYYLNKKQVKVAIFALIIVAFILRLILTNYNYGVFYFTFTRMDELAVGAFLAILEVEGKLKNTNSKKFILMFFLIMLPTLALWAFTGGLGMDSIQIIKFALYSFGYFSLIGLILTIKDTHWLKRILRFSMLSFTGKISYGLYVYHPLCFLLISKYLTINSVLLSLVVSFAFSYTIAWLSYYFFESKFLLLKSKFENKQENVLKSV